MFDCIFHRVSSGMSKNTVVWETCPSGGSDDFHLSGALSQKGWAFDKTLAAIRKWP